MCGIAGWVDLKKNISENTGIVESMMDTLKKRGPDDSGICVYKNALLGHRRLVVVDPEGGHQPMTNKLDDRSYTIVYNGELYNTEEVRAKLIAKGYHFNSYSDTEVLLDAFIEWGPECVNEINGIFAFGIWDDHKQTLFLARDPLGVKPLFYSIVNDSIIFASEIKALLKHPDVKPVVDQEGILEIFGLGPARSLGSGIFKQIKEIPPANYMIYNENGHKLTEYWKLKADEHKESFDETVDYVRNLLIDAIERQLYADVPVCTFLSGGLDSSAISAIASSYFKKKGIGRLKTFSIDYKDNSKYFKKSVFQPNSDSDWVYKMADYIDSDHTGVILDNVELAEALSDAVYANDYPGMADIDSSLYLFCREIRKQATVGLSGECADEIFGGYPWFTRKEDIEADTFPWSKSVSERRSILSKDLKSLPLEDYVQQHYHDSLKQVPHIEGESYIDSRMRELFYINIKWFMITLLNRKDRMSMSNSLEVRVPFADYRIVEYSFNIPSEMKFYKQREKGLLRESLKGILPDEIVYRKKSPYPKTHNPVYTETVKKIMSGILDDKSSPILQLIDVNKVREIVDTGGQAYTKPWYGQLMTGPQVIAFLIQINTWMKHYNVILE